MKQPLSISRLLLFVAMGGLIALSFLAIRVLERDVEAYRQSNQEAIHWSAAQVEVELSRFLLALSQFGAHEGAVDKAGLNRRFDLLWSRTGLFRSGRIGERLREADRGLGAIPLTIAILQQNEQKVLTLRPGDVATRLELIETFSSLQDPLRRLSVKVLSGEQERYAAVRTTLLDSSRMTFWVWAATLVLAALLVGVMFLEARRYMRMIKESARLAEQAQSANRTKSRFLTMMSHELRTPMNGVMGLMALAKQSGLNEKQHRLIEQAERSGSQMVGLLGDILDFSDLQSERLALEVAPFQPAKLGTAVTQALDGLGSRNALTMSCECPNSVPEWVQGDMARLRQALVHLCSYFVEIVGTRDLKLVMAHDGTDLVIEIDIQAQEADRPGWQPEAIFGNSGTDQGDFATDSVGPTIARGLIEVMNGGLRMRRTVAGRASLFVQVPAPEVALNLDAVRVEAQSDTTALLLHAAIDETIWRIWSPAISPARVAAVLLEPSGAQDRALVQRYRAEHPGARVISVGKPLEDGVFDAICEVPLASGALTELLKASPDRARTA